MTSGLGIKQWGCGAYQVCSNDDPRLTLTYLRQGQICFLMHLHGKFLDKLIFLKTVKALVLILT